MSILEIRNLTHRYDDRFLFNNASLSINNGEHLGIVGLNGAGKTTFINIIAGNLSQDDGEVLRGQNMRWGYLDQHADIDRSLTVMEYLKSAFLHLYKLNEKLEALYLKMGEEMEANELDKLITKSSRYQEELDNSGFYDLDSKIKKVAGGLGIANVGYDTIISRLSGGERAKLMLSKLLLEEVDVMLLDEPTNFLDIEHIEWLKKYLNTYKKTFLVISHDTDFLDGVCKFIINIENGNIKKYSGNYTEFSKQREMNAKQYEESYLRQQAEIKKMKDYIEKNKARAATAGMANSRKKMLDKIEIMQKPAVIYDAVFNFPYIPLNSKDFLIIKGLEVGYDKTLIPPIDIHLSSQDKLWIRGTNGVGKTTFIKTITRRISAIKGSFNYHIAVKPAILNQELDFENDNMSAMQYYNEAFPRANVKEQRGELAKVGLKGELALKPIKNMSGGEQVRTKLSVLCNTPSNLLILDEPTNHLDVRAKEALKEALIKYEGAIILVSHEKDFAGEICNKIFDAKTK
ncbi:MAG: ABC-F family ATP-binding cassette domain-containing protein [Clostridia bacterium]|nr:ABC-F family ATP-binding cassette domain-containing protein [Clostridia bacterium]